MPTDRTEDSRPNHWEKAHQAKSAQRQSWFQSAPELSLQLIEQYATPKARVIDIGGGISSLADCLLDRGFPQPTAIDLSKAALETSQNRLGQRKHSVKWIVGSVLDAELYGPYDLWHDRAVFHFFTDAADQDRYVDRMFDRLAPQGVAVMATFALDGPEKCSGLEVQRYSTETLHERVGLGRFDLLDAKTETHRTPHETDQRFQYSVFRKIG